MAHRDLLCAPGAFYRLSFDIAFKVFTVFGYHFVLVILATSRIRVNPLMLKVAKCGLTSKKSIVGKICEWEMLLWTLLIALLQIFCNIIFDFQAIDKKYLGSRRQFNEKRFSIDGLTTSNVRFGLKWQWTKFRDKF